MILPFQFTLMCSGFCQLIVKIIVVSLAIPILTEWCSWSLTVGEPATARAQLDEVLKRAGADPFSGKIFWDAKLELEKAQLETLT